MKYINQVVFIVLAIVLVFLIKSDYKSIYSKTLSYLQNDVGVSTDLKNRMGDIVNSINIPTGNNKNNESAPGALVVSDSYLASSVKNVNLSSKKVIEITNKYRSINGNLPALTENSKLDFSAEKKLQDMFVKGYFEHISPNGTGVGDLGSEVGYEYIIIGENLALGNFKDDQSLVDAWMASPGHRANILNNRYKEIGVSVGKGTYNGQNVWMAVQHFGLPKSACPSIDEVLKGIIDLDQQRIKDMEKDLASKKAKIDSGAVSEGMTTNGQIDAYNSLVSDYNKIILDIKSKINKYNSEVRDFNTCISSVN